VRRHREAYGDNPIYRAMLDPGGDYAFRLRGEDHAWTPERSPLQHAVRGKLPEEFKAYARVINEQSERLLTIRGLMEMKWADKPCAGGSRAGQGQSCEDLRRAMSFGSISREAHTTLAIAMNRIGASRTPAKAARRPTASSRCPTAIRCAPRSSRWRLKIGVTAEYLVTPTTCRSRWRRAPARRGRPAARPQVDRNIARVRHSTPGVGLISPPPHHDIYSHRGPGAAHPRPQERQPRARVSVKLVSEVGVGTVAAGVSKARADHVTISGFEGGTGASPLTSLTHAGSAVEIGLAETQQTLVLNGLRGRYRSAGRRRPAHRARRRDRSAARRGECGFWRSTGPASPPRPGRC